MNKIFKEIIKNWKNLYNKYSIFQKISYSQDGEDVVLNSFYEDKPGYKGFYVDIGALHPFRFSNTQIFYDKGWRGINIDATPESMKEFNFCRPEDLNIEAGVSREAGELEYYIFKETAMNSFDRDLSEKRIKDGWEFIGKKKVKTYSINEILDKNIPEEKIIDFMNIDIEGLEVEILKSLDWRKYKPNFLLIEDLNFKEKNFIGYENLEIYKFLKELNYIVVAKTKRTIIFKNILENGR